MQKGSNTREAYERQHILARMLQMADGDMLFSLCSASVVAVLMKRRQRRSESMQNLELRMADKWNLFPDIFPSNTAITASALSLLSVNFCNPLFLHRFNVESSHTD